MGLPPGPNLDFQAHSSTSNQPPIIKVMVMILLPTGHLDGSALLLIKPPDTPSGGPLPNAWARGARQTGSNGDSPTRRGSSHPPGVRGRSRNRPRPSRFQGLLSPCVPAPIPQRCRLVPALSVPIVTSPDDHGPAWFPFRSRLFSTSLAVCSGIKELLDSGGCHVWRP